MTENDEVRERAEARVGTVLKGKYRLERVLGVGGMAVVYAAVHRNNSQAAIKMLHPELSLRKDIRERFLREGYIANSVKHPGAVVVSDDDVAEDGAAFLVMELLQGAPVETLIEKHGGTLPAPAAIAICTQLLDVLAAAHTHAIVHRDIKPANVFVTLDGTVKVLDFGIARIRDAAGGTETSAGLIMGTPAFMSPEQALGQTSEIGLQSDVWAVGATLFTMLAGQHVHPGGTGHELFIRAATTRARPTLSVLPQLPPDLAQCIDVALEFNKRDRWPNAASMRDALLAVNAAHFGGSDERQVLGALMQPGAATRISAPSFNRSEPPRSAPPSTTVGSSAPSFDFGNPLPFSPAGATRNDAYTPAPKRLDATTAQPVARPPSVGPMLAPPRSSNRTVLAAALSSAGAVAILGGGIYFFTHSKGPDAPPSASSGGPTSSRTEAPPPATAPPTVAPPARVAVVAEEPPAIPVAAPTTVPTASTPPREAAHPRVEGHATAVHPAVVAPPPPPPAVTATVPPLRPAKPPVSCDPPYTISASGTRIPKPECDE